MFTTAPPAADLSNAWIEGDESARWRSTSGHGPSAEETVPHEVRNAGEETLRFVAVCASTEVTTTYEDEVQPDGEREKDPIG